MDLEQLNQLVDLSMIAFALTIIAFVLVFTVFRRDVEKLEKLKK